jgi:mono/diheme cytochrome c family protein
VQLPKEQLTDPNALMFNGYAKADVDCWRCHNGDGRGSGHGPSLVRRISRLSEARLAHMIRDGGGVMPDFKKTMTEEEILAMVKWLKVEFPLHTQ